MKATRQLHDAGQSLRLVKSLAAPHSLNKDLLACLVEKSQTLKKAG